MAGDRLCVFCGHEIASVTQRCPARDGDHPCETTVDRVRAKQAELEDLLRRTLAQIEAANDLIEEIARDDTNDYRIK